MFKQSWYAWSPNKISLNYDINCDNDPWTTLTPFPMDASTFAAHHIHFIALSRHLTIWIYPTKNYRRWRALSLSDAFIRRRIYLWAPVYREDSSLSFRPPSSHSQKSSPCSILRSHLSLKLLFCSHSQYCVNLYSVASCFTCDWYGVY